jgi:hypothetical protein
LQFTSVRNEKILIPDIDITKVGASFYKTSKEGEKNLLVEVREEKKNQ